ncbi:MULTISPECIES: ATP-dependent zinc metalloprotease FtsH [Clostridium]|uniref:ATP-dependent zinc metalloprotease FtsH n=1 Tax=Clostridium TaxID=1485 RepID=UPI000825337E|nr:MULTISPECIES: ATP-dependent zinc metalloprotease FtsH [Clostridium]PJI07757.1 ATP-dependent zinc metalloprotease FtsH [Clostridium sp. CT7]
MFDNKDFKDKKFKYAIYYTLGVIVFVLLFNYAASSIRTEEISYNKFLDLLKAKKISQVNVSQQKIVIVPKDNAGYQKKILYTGRIDDSDLKNELKDSGAEIKPQIQNDDPIKSFVINWILPIILLTFLGKILFGKLDKKFGGGVMSFGKNNAKLYAENETGKTFDDVAGQEEAKESLIEIVDFLHNPNKYTEIGAKLPKGALLVGPPGTGKTLLAKAVAGEAKVPFFSMSGSDFVEMFVGMGAARVRDLFEQAQEKAPCIIFIDEIDAIGKSRESAVGGSNDEREQTLNQLLAEMDGFDSSKGVVILAATNRPEVLDKALLRPGRFDRRVIVDRPDLKGREAILKVHSKDVKMSEDISLEDIAKATSGAVGADLANIVNEAALLAVKRGRSKVIQEDLDEAVEVIVAGKEKKDKILSDQDKKTVAYHEVGHALVAALLRHTNPVHKITIIPTTMGALGYTMQLPEEEKYLVTKEEMSDQICVMLGGRSSEEVVFGTISTGASNDIEKATQTARNMVTIYGMTDKFDMMALESAGNRYLDGRPVKNCSNEVEYEADKEVLRIIKEAHNKAKDILQTNRELLDNIAEILLEKETLSGDEFMKIVKESSAWKEMMSEETETQKLTE